MCVVFWLGGRNSSVGSVCWACYLAVEEIFLLELTWVLTPFPYSLSDEGRNWGLVFVPMYSIAKTQKIPTFMSWVGKCWQQKHIQHAPSMKTECDYRCGWIKHTHTHTHTHTYTHTHTRTRTHTHNGYICKISPKNGESQRYSWEHRRSILQQIRENDVSFHVAFTQLMHNVPCNWLLKTKWASQV